MKFWALCIEIFGKSIHDDFPKRGKYGEGEKMWWKIVLLVGCVWQNAVKWNLQYARQKREREGEREGETEPKGNFGDCKTYRYSIGLGPTWCAYVAYAAYAWCGRCGRAERDGVASRSTGGVIEWSTNWDNKAQRDKSRELHQKWRRQRQRRRRRQRQQWRWRWQRSDAVRTLCLLYVGSFIGCCCCWLHAMRQSGRVGVATDL